MATEKRLTRSMVNSSGKKDIDDPAPPTKRKRKAREVNESESKEANSTSPARIGNKQRKVSRDKTSPSTRKLQPRKDERRLYQVEKKETFNISLKKEQVCSVWSMCLLDSGDLLIADNSNPVLKQINGNTYRIRNTLKLPATSQSVCKVNESEAIVALSNNSIQFVSTKEKLSATRTHELGHCCLGICHVAGFIYITDGKDKNVFVYNMEGKLIKKIDGESIFGWNRFVAESEDGNAIYITDMDEGLLKLNRNGKVMWSCLNTSLKDAFGVCTDGRGNVFVSNYDSHHVVQIDSDGRCLGKIVPPNMCVLKTAGMCFDNQKLKIFVAGCFCMKYMCTI